MIVPFWKFSVYKQYNNLQAIWIKKDYIKKKKKRKEKSSQLLEMDS